MEFSRRMDLRDYRSKSQDPARCNQIQAGAIDGQRPGHALTQGFQRPLVGVDTNNPEQDGLLKHADRLLPEFLGILPLLIAIDRIEAISDPDDFIAAPTNRGRVNALDEAGHDEFVDAL